MNRFLNILLFLFPHQFLFRVAVNLLGKFSVDSGIEAGKMKDRYHRVEPDDDSSYIQITYHFYNEQYKYPKKLFKIKD